MASSPGLLAREARRPRRYQPAVLVTRDGSPLRSAEVEAGQCYVFNYPYQVTPCFLLDLGRPIEGAVPLTTEEGARYEWPGGVGPDRSLVSFSAICAHKMSHPARAVSFINYRHEETAFADGKQSVRKQAQVIYCCSERSVYDPAQGARVLGGPAQQPLAAIALEHDPDRDELRATATYGGEMFDRFFSAFRRRLELEHATTDIRRPIAGSTTVLTMAEYSAAQIMC